MKYYYLYTQLDTFIGAIKSEEYPSFEEARSAAADIISRNPLYKVEIWLFNDGENTLIEKLGE